MQATCIRTIRLLGLVLLFSSSANAKKLSEEIKFHRSTLTTAKIPLTAEGLLNFFRSRTPSKQDIASWEARIKELGSRDYRVREKAMRELTRAGWPAIGYLQQAAKSFDVEVARRAERCMEAIGQTPNEELLIAAASVISELKPKGAIQAILGCLPGVTEQRAREAVFNALREIDLDDREVSKAVVDAGKSPNPILREAAVHVLAHAKANQRKQAFALLNDQEITVRYAAAYELVMAQEKSAIPHLIELLKNVNRAQSYQIEDVLYHLAGEEVKITSPQQWETADRRKYRNDWLAWWNTHEKMVDLARLNRRDILLGLNLVIEYNGSPGGGGRVFECGRNGKPRWEFKGSNYPIDAQLLSNGNVLVAEHGQACVTIRDRKGKELWRHKVNSSAVACQRLRNGNIFVAHYKGATEITPDHKVVYDLKVPGSIYYGMKLRDGNVLLSTSNGKILEMDTKGNTLHTIPVPGTSYWSSAEKLSNGRYLVAAGSAGKVVEVDKAGKVYWEFSATHVGHATRLPNGNTLVTLIDQKKIQEVNRAKNVIWEITTVGRPFHAYRR